MAYAAPLTLWQGPVRSEWIDEFDHVNIAHYLTICDLSNWAFWNLLNAPDAMETREGREYAIVENHVHYLGELSGGEEISVTTQLLAWDDKRFVLFHRVLKPDGSVSALNEVKFLGFDLCARRAMAWVPRVRERLAEVLASHEVLPVPEQAGRGIALKSR